VLNVSWQLVHDKDIMFYQLKWKETTVLYSTKQGEAAFLRKFNPILLHQIHSSTIVDLDRDHKRIGDGMVTRRKNYALGIKVADCLPVYLFNAERICIIHCGWRSIIRGIAKQASTVMRNYKYILGASIGVCCYEVREDLVESFSEKYENAVVSDNQRYFLDLKAAVVKDLGERYLLASLDLCTKCHSEYFYSYRRGDKKRNYAVILNNM